MHRGRFDHFNVASAELKRVVERVGNRFDEQRATKPTRRAVLNWVGLLDNASGVTRSAVIEG
jgi:hypothetical protein